MHLQFSNRMHSKQSQEIKKFPGDHFKNATSCPFAFLPTPCKIQKGIHKTITQKIIWL